MATSDAQPDESGSKPVTVEDAPKTHRAFSRLKRELTDEDLKSPGVQKLLLDYVAQADDEVSALKPFREKYHESDKQNGVLQEKLRTNRAFDAISTGTLAIGGAAVGYAEGVNKTV